MDDLRPPHRLRPAVRRLARRAAALATAAALTAVLPVTPASAGRAEELTLNRIQSIGTHNSYHAEPNAREFALISAFAGTQANGLQYTHVPLGRQFAGQNVRQIELDIWADPDGGRFARPLIRPLTGQSLEYDPRMREKGTKVLHIRDIDYHSTCVSFVECLTAVRDWSRANPSHVPIAILVEFKDTLELSLPDSFPLPPYRWTRARMLGLEEEIRSVFSADDLITPDDVRDDGLTLEQSVLRNGWPSLDAVRGKVMFLMDNAGSYRDRYVEGNPGLEGRILFTSSEPGRPDAAFVKRNDAVGSAEEIRSLVRSGYIVRTRADADTAQARSGDTSVRDAALASGAQWVSTDYPVPGIADRFGTGYYAALPGFAAARCNPVLTSDGCTVTSP
ncbi:phosphatidylinositol-specific phospholipase C1-like protein [Actinomadura miaoliensis]|uniref:Phosphatidylinositol-specific phospholipase C1-like protein n=1 Tax=Actinomadura miaoliensis TaxID=430685 RepID=A0ABP7VQY8_9ACTN